MLAIDRYFEIQEMVNKSLDLVEKANSTVNNITNMVGEKVAWISREIIFNAFIFVDFVRNK